MLPSIGPEPGRGLTSSGVASTARSAASWRNAYILLGSCLLLLLLLHAATAAAIVRTWSHDPFAHGYFVIVAAAYLAWSRRQRLDSLSLRPAFVALPLLGLLSFRWLLGNLAGKMQVQQLCLVTMVLALTWAVLGTDATRALLLPLGLLFFALPFSERLAPALQEFTARFALRLLMLSGVQAVLEGHVIAIAEDRWRVAEACGGINYLTASLAVGYLYAGLVYRQRVHRAAFLVASVIVPLAANGLRVYTTILLDYAGATRIVAGMGHYLYGVLVFGIIMGVLFMTCGRWREEPSTGEGPLALPQRTAAAAAPASARRMVLCATLGMLLLAIGPVAASILRLPPGTETTIRPNRLATSLHTATR